MNGLSSYETHMAVSDQITAQPQHMVVSLWTKLSRLYKNNVLGFIVHIGICWGLTNQFIQLLMLCQSCNCGFHLSLSAGEEAPMSVLHRCQRKRMGDGISNSLHQGNRWSSRQRGTTGRTKEWSCEYLHRKILLFKPIFRIINAICSDSFIIFFYYIDP